MIAQKNIQSVSIDGVLNDTIVKSQISINNEEIILNLTAALIPNNFKEKILNRDYIGKEATLIEEVRNSETAEDIKQEIVIKITNIYLEYCLSSEENEPALYHIYIYGIK